MWIWFIVDSVVCLIAGYIANNLIHNFKNRGRTVVSFNNNTFAGIMSMIDALSESYDEEYKTQETYEDEFKDMLKGFNDKYGGKNE